MQAENVITRVDTAHPMALITGRGPGETRARSQARVWFGSLSQTLVVRVYACTELSA